MTNFLEQLVREYYSHMGYFVKTNIKFGLRTRGGYIGEIDVLAYHLTDLSLVHIETSTDQYSWTKRMERFKTKFENARNYYRELFKFDYSTVQRIAVVGFGDPPSEFHHIAPVMSIPHFIEKVAEYLTQYHPLHQAVSETYPRLRAMQYIVHYGGKGLLKPR